MNEKIETRETREFPHSKKFSKIKLFTVICSVSIGLGANYLFSSFSVLKTTIKTDLGINNSEYGLLNSTPSISGVFMPFLSGIFIGKRGHTYGCILSIVLTTIGCGIISLVPFYHSYSLLLFGKLIAGLGSNALSVASSSLLVYWFEGSKMAKVLGVEMAFASLISLISTTTTLPLYSAFHFYGVSFIVSDILNIFGILVLLIYIFTSNTVPDIKIVNEDRFNMKSIFYFPMLFWILTLTRFFGEGIGSSIGPSLTEFISYRFNVSQTVASYYISLPKIASIVFSIPLGFFVRRVYHRDYLLLFTQVFGFLLSCLLFFTKTNPIIPILLSSIIHIIMFLNLFAIKSTIIEKKNISTAFGISTSVGNLSHILFNIVSGKIQDNDRGSYINVVKFWTVMLFMPILLTIWYVIYNRLYLKNKNNNLQRKTRTVGYFFTVLFITIFITSMAFYILNLFSLQ